MRTIGILYIATGSYIIFWKDFFESFEKFFLGNTEKHYYVFTDCINFFACDNPRVHVVYQEAEPWPLPTLLKYDKFLKLEDELINLDFLYQANANTQCVAPVNEEDFLPRRALGEKLFFTCHPGYENKSVIKHPYERNYRSTAYVPYNYGSTYVFGAMNGGEAEPFLQMMKLLNGLILDDLKRGVIAKVHDESHVNHFYLTCKDSRLLPSTYACQGIKDNSAQFIVCVDKSLYLDVNGIKDETINVYKKKYSMTRFISKHFPVLWKIRDIMLHRKIIDYDR